MDAEELAYLEAEKAAEREEARLQYESYMKLLEKEEKEHLDSLMLDMLQSCAEGEEASTKLEDTVTRFNTETGVDPELVADAEQAQDAAVTATDEMSVILDKALEAAPLCLSSPKQPHQVAKELVEKYIPLVSGERALTSYNGHFYQWTGSRWAMVSDEHITFVLSRFLHEAMTTKTVKGETLTVSWEADSRKIGEVDKALRSHVLYKPRRRLPIDKNEIACANGVVNAKKRIIRPHDPKIFRTFASPVAFDPAAKCPAWEAFLADVFEHDPGLVRTLQHWFGYVLADGGISHQKIALLIGAARAGKGVISRILTELIGASSVTNLGMQGLSDSFGLASALDARLILMPDVKWGAVRGTDAAINRLLNISGGDSVDVNRKFKMSLNVRLEAKFMILTNSLPRFEDEAGGMLGRFIPITFQKSFVGREDIGLERRLLAELPGILRWAVEGLGDLLKLGHIFEAPSCVRERDAVRRSTQPLRDFIDEFIAHDPEGGEVEVGKIWDLFTQWKEDSGNTRMTVNRDALIRMITSTLNTDIEDPDSKLMSIRRGGGQRRRSYLKFVKLATGINKEEF